MNEPIISEFKEQLRLCNIYLDECNNLRTALCIDNTNPNTTMGIYFASLQMQYFVTQFIGLRNDFKKLNIFEDPFEAKAFLPVNTLWIFCENVINNKDNIQQLVDLNFMNSKARTLRLFGLSNSDYKDLIDLWEKNIKDLIERLENIHETWYIKNKHYSDNSDFYFVDKEEMALYKLIEMPDSNQFGNFRLKKCTVQKDTTNYIEDISISPDRIRPDIRHEMFLDDVLGELFPEYFI